MINLHYSYSSFVFLNLFMAATFNNLFAADSAIICPQGSSYVEFFSKVYLKKTFFCQIQFEGRLVKHGPEEIQDLNGKILEKNFYQYGQKDKSKVVIPGVSGNQTQFVEAFATPTSTPMTIAPKDNVIAFLQFAFPLFKKNSSSSFRIDKCPNYDSKWVKVLTVKLKERFNYHFIDGCDVEGTIISKDNGDLQFDMKLNNLPPFESIKMVVKVTASQESIKNGIPFFNVTFSTLEAKLLSPPDNKETEFSAEYTVVINPLIKNLITENKGGHIHFTKLLGEMKDLNEKLFFDGI